MLTPSTLRNHPLFTIPDLGQIVINWLNSIEDINVFTVAFPVLRGLLTPNLIQKYMTDGTIESVKKTLGDLGWNVYMEEDGRRTILSRFLVPLENNKARSDHRQLVVSDTVHVHLAIRLVTELLERGEHFCLGCYPTLVQGRLWSVIQHVLAVHPQSTRPPVMHKPRVRFFNMQTLSPPQWLQVFDMGMWTPQVALHDAIKLDLNAVKFILEQGANIQNDIIQSACSEAADGKRIVLDYFVELGADPIVGLAQTLPNRDLLNEIVRGHRERHGKKLCLHIVSDALSQCINQKKWDVFDFLLENGDLGQDDDDECLLGWVLNRFVEVDPEKQLWCFERLLDAGVRCIHWKDLQEIIIFRGHVLELERMLAAGYTLEPITLQYLFDNSLMSRNPDMVKFCYRYGMGREWEDRLIMLYSLQKLDVKQDWLLIDAAYDALSTNIDLVEHLVQNLDPSKKDFAKYFRLLRKDVAEGSDERIKFVEGL
ncbi:hypothetical protein HDU97_007717 [Phlyctochytrium planicorne]|nr:hypothetical protein HDU97_007717 [Phlyctochytrium planicorne]